jgi:hypothetical protein
VPLAGANVLEESSRGGGVIRDADDVNHWYIATQGVGPQIRFPPHRDGDGQGL